MTVAIAGAVTGATLNVTRPAASNAALTPAGSPDALNDTVPLKPLSFAMDTAADPLAPRTTVRLRGATDIPKSGAGSTATGISSIAERLPEAPLTVTIAVAGTATDEAVSVSVLAVVALDGLNDAVTPPGKPAAVKATAPLNPPEPVTPMGIETAPPGTIFALETVDDRVKPCGAAATTVNAMYAFAVRLPDVPVKVTVDVPAAADPLAAIVTTPPAPGVAVTPVGNPPIATDTVPAKPFCGVTVIVLVADPP